MNGSLSELGSGIDGFFQVAVLYCVNDGGGDGDGDGDDILICVMCMCWLDVCVLCNFVYLSYPWELNG